MFSLNRKSLLENTYVRITELESAMDFAKIHLQTDFNVLDSKPLPHVQS